MLIEKIVFEYPAVTAPTLKGVSCEVRSGELVPLCGGSGVSCEARSGELVALCGGSGSGSGETTLLKPLGRANNDDGVAVRNSNSDAVTVDGCRQTSMQTAF